MIKVSSLFQNGGDNMAYDNVFYAHKKELYGYVIWSGGDFVLDATQS